jgi:hypothetical protein
MHERPEVDGDDGSDLARRFVVMCVSTWARFRRPNADLAPAMLAHAVNLMIEDGGPDEAAAVLAGLAAEISTPETAGHA